MKKPQIPVSLRDKERLAPREYLRLRRKEPGWSRPLDMTDRVPRIKTQRGQLSEHGFDSDLLIDLLRSSPADPETQDFGAKTPEQIIDQLSLQLIKVIEGNRAKKRKQRNAYARNGQLLPDSLINDVVIELVELLVNLQLDMPHGLLSLLQMRLDPKLTNPIHIDNNQTKRSRAIFAIARNASISTRELAKFAGVNQSTAARWKNDAEIQRQAKELNNGGPK